MGVSDRSYMRGRGQPPILIGSSWTLRLLIALVVVFLFTKGAWSWWRWDVRSSLELSLAAVRDGRLWTVVTSAFLHDDAGDLLFDGVGLWIFAKLVEDALGTARFLAFALLAVVLPHLVFLVVQAAGRPGGLAVGTSGLVMASLAFAALRDPRAPHSLFGLVPVQTWHLALLYVVLDLVGQAQGIGRIDLATRLAGLALGLAVQRFGLVPSLRLPSFRRAPKPHHERGPFAAGNVDREIDRILDKINESGISSLTDEERDYLKRNSRPRG